MNDADQGADKARAHEVWLAQIQEEALEAELPICDAHHHLWLDSGHTGWPYPIEALHADTNTGHNVVHTVFLECGAEYRTDGLAAPWQDEIRFCIDQFGPNRCFFESNFPVDKRCCSYMVLWNTFKRIASIYTAAEKRDRFHDNAARG